MTILEGGLRDRMIDISVYRTVRDGLASIGWFDDGRKHKPIVMLPTPVSEGDKVEPNTLVFSSENIIPGGGSLGGYDSVDTFDVWFDFYGESDALGKHIMGDVRSMVVGQFASQGFEQPVIGVYDWESATPALQFTVDIESAERVRRHDGAKPYERHWWSVFITLEDERQ